MKWTYFVATGFGLGKLPWFPGTWGALGALLCYLLLSPFLTLAQELGLGLIFLLLGIWVSERVSQNLKQKDPKEIVIDEIVGQWIGLLGEASVGGLLWRFVLFRLFDIYKPFPVRYVERFPGGWGIMADDLVAGLLTNISFTLIKYGLKFLVSVS